MRPDEWARVKSLFEAVSAIAARRRTIQNGYWHVDVLQSDTDHDSLRDEPEFQRLLVREPGGMAPSGK